MSTNNIPIEKTPGTGDWILLGLLSLIWGSSFILIKKSLIAMDYIQMASMRISISTIAFLPVILFYRKKIEVKKLPYVALIGILGAGIPAYSYAFAQTQIASSVTGILNSLTPFFTFIIGILFFNSKFKKNKLIGLTLGFIGALMLIFQGSLEQSNNILYAFFIVLGTMCYGFNINVVKKHFQESNPILLTALSFGIIGGPAIAYLYLTDAVSEILSSPEASISISSILILSLIGTVVANILYFRLAQSTSAVFASSVAYLMPIVALFWGILDNETINLIQLASFGVIVYGVYLIRK